MTTGTVPRPTLDDEAAELQQEIDRYDIDIFRLICARVDAAQRLAEARCGLGGSRFAHDLELATVRRFRELGPVGTHSDQISV
jgi:hypothetical protein